MSFVKARPRLGRGIGTGISEEPALVLSFLKKNLVSAKWMFNPTYDHPASNTLITTFLNPTLVVLICRT